jgi:hypothetical protein
MRQTQINRSSVGAAPAEYAAPDGADFVLVDDSTKMSRLRRWNTARPQEQEGVKQNMIDRGGNN